MIDKLTDVELKALFKEGKEKHDFEIVKEDLQRHLENYFENLDFDNVDEVSARLYNMINYAIGRYDHYANLRHKYLTLGLSIIGVGATLIGVSTNFFGTINFVSEVLVILSFISLLISGLKIVFVYNKYTTADYPYRKIVNIQSWYFKYKLGEKSSLSLSNVYSKAFKQVEYVTKDYLKGLYSWVDKANSKNYFIKEDLEQVAILHLLQKYGRDCVERMKKTLMIGLLLFTILFGFAFVIEILCDITLFYSR